MEEHHAQALFGDRGFRGVPGAGEFLRQPGDRADPQEPLENEPNQIHLFVVYDELAIDNVVPQRRRIPNGRTVGAENAGVKVDDRGFIPVDKQMRTNVTHIIVGHRMLAHKAPHEGETAAEVAAGCNSFFDARVVPSVAYTDPSETLAFAADACEGTIIGLSIPKRQAAVAPLLVARNLRGLYL